MILFFRYFTLTQFTNLDVGTFLFLFMPIISYFLLEENFKKSQERKREAEEKRIGRFAKEVEENCPELEEKEMILGGRKKKNRN
jgi:hypothetical protein